MAMEYQIISGRASIVQDAVTKALNDGWALHGSLQIAVTKGGALCVQAVTRTVQSHCPP
jgi:hypothetical protein